MYKNCNLKLIKFAERIDINVIRLVATYYLLIGTLGLLWFFDTVISGKHLFDTTISVIPLLSLFVGIITPDKWLQNKLYFVFYQAAIIIGVPCVAVSTVRALTFFDTPSYSTFALRLVALLVLLIFILHAVSVRKNKINASNVGTSDQSTGSDSIDPKNPFL